MRKVVSLANKYRIVIILMVIFFAMLILNYLTPLMVDDFGYSMKQNKEPIKNIVDIINFQIFHYMSWGGRTIAHTIGQVFLLLPKNVFNIFNSLCFCMLIYLMYDISKGEKKTKALILCAIAFAVYFLPPVFGQNTLWLIGACNYLWTMVIILLLDRYFEKNVADSKLRIILLFLFGLIAGWTNENTSFGNIVILSSFLIFKRIEKKTIKKWQISALIGNCVGFLILILAPGNFERTKSIKDNTFIIIKWIYRFINCNSGIINYFLPLIITFMLLTSLYYLKNKKINYKAWIYMLGAIFSIYPMIMSPVFYERSWFGIIVYAIIADAILVYDLDIINKKLYYCILINGLIITTLFFTVDYFNLLRDIKGFKDIWNNRLEMIRKNKNKNSITFDIYTSYNRKNPSYGLGDINEDPKLWPNTELEKYFGIKKIIGKSN